METEAFKKANMTPSLSRDRGLPTWEGGAFLLEKKGAISGTRNVKELY